MKRFVPFHRPRRSGMTLIELMVAIVLSTVVLGAMQAALHTHWKLRDAGTSQVETARVARAIHQDFVGDIRGLRSLPSEPSAEAEFVSSGQLSVPDTQHFEERLLNIRPLQFVEPVGVYLRPRVVAFGCLKQNHRFQKVDQPEETRRACQTIWWWNDGRADTEVPIGKSQEKVFRVTLKGDRWPQGLIRLQIPVDLTERPLGTSSLEAAEIRTSGGRVDVIDAADRDISDVRLRCLAGETWSDSWDSSRSGQYPRAIELTLTVGTETLRLVSRTDAHD